MSTQATPNQPHTAALDSSDGVTTGLRGPIGTNDYHSLTKLAHILGLDTPDALKKWMNGNSFKPAFDELYHDWIAPQQEMADKAGKPRKRGPGLKAIVKAIDFATSIKDCRYIELFGIDKSEFTDVDHYALCLVRLRVMNTQKLSGLFVNKSCSQEEMDQRLWQAIHRASAELGKSRTKKLSAIDQHYPEQSDDNNTENDCHSDNSNLDNDGNIDNKSQKSDNSNQDNDD